MIENVAHPMSAVNNIESVADTTKSGRKFCRQWLIWIKRRNEGSRSRSKNKHKMQPAHKMTHRCAAATSASRPHKQNKAPASIPSHRHRNVERS